MIYIVTEGEYSDYGVSCVIQRDAPLGEGELVSIKALYDTLPKRYDRVADPKAWARALCDGFGFRLVPHGELRCTDMFEHFAQVSP